MPLSVFCNMHQQPANRARQPLASNEALRFEVRSNEATDALTGPFNAARKVS
jgi:hypothetical protein